MSLAVVAGSVALTTSVASAAPGDITTSTSAALAPSAIAGATPSRLVRLPKTDSFLAFGRDTTTAGSHNFLWKVKSDLSIDTTFGAIDLGDEFAYPTSAESICVSANNSTCAYGTIVVSEKLDKYAIYYSRQLKGTASSDQLVLSFAVGSLSTGAVSSRSMFLSMIDSNGSATAANYAAYSTNEIAKDQCIAATGATKNSIPLAYAYSGSMTIQFRPDASVFFGILCEYSNYVPGPNFSQSETYRSSILVGLKTSGSSLVVDTSFGTNGQVVTFDPTTNCEMMSMGVNTVDASVSSVTSTTPYFVVINSEYARPNTGGCSYGGMNTVYTNKITPYTANGTPLTTQTISTGDMAYVGRWVIDPLGRWNGVIGSMGMTPSFSAIRLANGVLDTTLGANGLKQLTLPSSITVGGSSVYMNYSISGVVNAGNNVYFTGLAQSSSGTSINRCSSTATETQTYYPYFLSFDTGLLTTYGTSGLGAPGSFSAIEKASCGGPSAETSYVDTTGRIGYVTSVAALGSQAAGYVGMKWDAAQGVTSGSDGDVGVPQETTTTTVPVVPVVPVVPAVPVAPAARVVPNRIDKVVYAKKLPRVVQTNTALKVLSKKDAANLDIRTVTPKTCVALTTSVLLVKRGRCSIQIIDEETKVVVRSLSTIVKASKVRVGSVPTIASPVMFNQSSAILNSTGRARIRKIAAAAKGASRIVVIGHAASLTNVTKYRFAISRERAISVKKALIKAGVTATIEIVAQSDNQPVKTKKTETSQAHNRRANVYIFR
jgi:outer membrane protein OmpA-like peptidoglycan-associated protein